MVTNMKKLLIILAIFLTPSFAYATLAAPWSATSTNKGYIYPNAINGNFPAVLIGATSTPWNPSNGLIVITGNVGIGTTSPGSLLSIQGIANFTTATSTFSSTGGISLTNGCFAIGNNCLTLSTISGTLGVGGGGTGITSVADGALLFGGVGGGTANLVALATSTGGFLTESYSTGRPIWSATSTLNVNILDTKGVLTIARGGTNNSNALSNGKVIISNADQYAESAITTTLLNYLSNVTSDIQSQFGTKVGTSSNETAGQIAVFGTTSGTPPKLYGVATSTLFTVNTSFSTTTTTIWIDANRTDTYTADGSIMRPFTTITAANAYVAAHAVITAATYEIAAGAATYAEQSQSFPSIPLVIHSNGATILAMSGGSVGAGTFTIPSDMTWYDLVLFGNISLTSSSLTNPHTLVNAFVAGNVTFAGLGFFSNSATADQNQAVYGFLSQTASSTFTAAAGSLVVVNSSQLNTVVNNSGFLNLDTVGVFAATSTRYTINSSAAGSQLAVNGATFINYNTGGGVNCGNTATGAAPNEMTNFSVTVGVGTASDKAINCGSATSFVQLYLANNFIGGRYYASGTALNALSMTGLNVEGNSLLNVNSGFVGLATSTPQWALQIATSTAPQLALSDASVLTNKHWTFRNAGGLLYFATSSPTTYATSTVSALTLDANGIPTFPSLSGSGCLSTSATGLIGISACSGGVASGNSKFATSTGSYLGITPNGGLGVGVGVGTSTPVWALTVASSTGAQIGLQDGSKTAVGWTLRNAGGLLYIATSSATSFATSTVPALAIDANGFIRTNTNQPVIDENQISSYLASSTLSYFGATTTITVSNPRFAATTTAIYCKADGGTSYGFRIGNGTASTTYMTCTTSGTALDPYTGPNGAFSARQDVKIDVGTPIGSPRGLTITISQAKQ